jgi:hypothetical protein
MTERSDTLTLGTSHFKLHTFFKKLFCCKNKEDNGIFEALIDTGQ